MNTIMQKLMEILNNLNPRTDWANERGYIDDGLIDSFDIISLVGDLNEAFEVKIELEHLTPENFNSAERILALLSSLGAAV